MALAAGTIYQGLTTAAANNVNGGGFNTGNANFPTDLAADTNTGNTDSPVVSSVTYNFVAGDVNTWLYVSAGTNWTKGFYQIASVATNKATLSAAVGAAVVWDSARSEWKPSTASGCATTGTPTGGTFGVDYSQGTTAALTNTDLTCTAASTTITSSTGGFTRMMVGNIVHLAPLTGTGAIIGWYELVNWTDTNNVVLDRTPTNGVNNITAGTFYVGGAMSMVSTLDDDFLEIAVAGNIFFIKTGTYVLGESVSIGAAGASTNPIRVIGFNSVRGDNPTGSTRSVFACATSNFTFGANWESLFFAFTTTGSTGVTTGSGGKFKHTKVTNISTTAAREAITASGDAFLFACEAISYRGRALRALVSSSRFISKGCYFHDSDVGVFMNGLSSRFLSSCIVEGNVTAAIDSTGTGASSQIYVDSCTLYGSVNTTGIGINIVTGYVYLYVTNSIIAGFVTGISHADVQTMSFDDYNCFNNNDTDTVNWRKGSNDTTTAPAFTSVGQVTGTTGAFVAGNGKLVDTTKNFTSLGVVAGQDCVYIISGTGVTAGIYGISSISTTTNPNDTLNLDINPGTDTTADKVYQITVGHNFSVTGAI